MSNELFLQKYSILKVLYSGGKINCYIANKINYDSKKFFIINEITDRNIINNCIFELMSLKDVIGFYDFVESFSENSKFYVVFFYKQYKSIKKVFETEKFAFDYRLELLKKILKELAENPDLNNILKASMLNPENIIFNENTINFNYRIFIDGDVESINDENNIYNSFCKLFRFFFNDFEIEKNSKLQIIPEKCNKNLYTSLGAVIRDLESVSKAIDKDEKLKNLFNEKKKKYSSLAVKISTVLVIGIMIFIIFKQIYENNEEATVYNDVEQIGNVDIESESVFETESDVNIFIENENETEVYDEFYTGNETISESDTENNLNEVFETEYENSTEELSIEETSEEIYVDEKVYIVKKNDNLTAIVKKEYGSDKYVKEICEYNGIKNGNAIEVGQVIKLPKIN